MANGHLLTFAFFSKVLRMKMASIVLLFFRKPNCSGPSKFFSSTIAIIFSFIREVSIFNILEDIVIGRY